MGRSLEGYRKSIDADVEKDGAQEIDWDNDEKTFEELQDTFSSLFTEAELVESSATQTHKESGTIEKGILESEEPEYDAETLGEATKNVPVQDKLDAEEQDKKMAELLAKEVEELEGIF